MNNVHDDKGRLAFTCYFAPDWNCWIVGGNLGYPITLSVWIVPGTVQS